MKISNFTVARNIAYTQLITICIIIIFVVSTHQLYRNLILILFSVLLIYCFIRIRTVVFEFSGGCVTVRSSHPLTYKKFIVPEFELPYTSINHVSIERRICFSVLIFNIRSNRSKNYKVKINILGLSKRQKNNLQDSLKLLGDKA